MCVIGRKFSYVSSSNMTVIMIVPSALTIVMVRSILRNNKISLMNRIVINQLWKRRVETWLEYLVVF